ncbi:ABC transporter permease subunit [Escherichia coli]|nr:ABC transporter permease subunit [Escherichia coli]WFY18298.1 ABC transporter permease subunit [Escherichia coli]
MTFWSILRQRCWGLVLVVAGVCVITFIISHLIPGDPARLLAGDRASDAIVENIRQQLGLDQPLYVQFYRYVSDLFHGDLGTSIRTGRPVLEELRIFFPATLELAFCALLLALLIGIPLGILSAVWRNRWLDHLVRIMAITGISTPAFWLGLGVIVLFYGHLQILPGGGRLDDWLDPPTHVTGFYLLDALLEGNGEVFFNALQHLILPALMRASLGRRYAMVGPLEAADMTGLSTVQDICRHLLPELATGSDMMSLVAEKVERGDIGVRSGQGFYCWDESRKQYIQQRREHQLRFALKP